MSNIADRCTTGTAKRAAGFVASLNLNPSHLDPEHDRCYCAVCYPKHLRDTIENEGPTDYVVPRGWVRFGLKVDVDESIWSEWSVSFHGAKSVPVLKSILQCGELKKPGDELPDGSILQSTKCAGRQAEVFYTSPTVKYAGLKFYAEPQPVGNGDTEASMVLVCRQRPGSFRTQGQTMGFDQWPGHLEQECRHVDLASVEWMSKESEHTKPYGLLIRTFELGLDGKAYRSPVDADHLEWRQRELQREDRNRRAEELRKRQREEQQQRAEQQQREVSDRVGYHGTSAEAAQDIITNGFKRSTRGMLGPGVYWSDTLDKAKAYPLGIPADQRVILHVGVRPGKTCKIDRQGHELQTTWHKPEHGYDTAWVPPHCGMVASGLSEDCTYDPARFTILSVSHDRGQTWQGVEETRRAEQKRLETERAREALRVQYRQGTLAKTPRGVVGVVIQDARPHGFTANKIQLRSADGSTTDWLELELLRVACQAEREQYEVEVAERLAAEQEKKRQLEEKQRLEQEVQRLEREAQRLREKQEREEQEAQRRAEREEQRRRDEEYRRDHPWAWRWKLVKKHLGDCYETIEELWLRCRVCCLVSCGAMILLFAIIMLIRWVVIKIETAPDVGECPLDAGPGDASSLLAAFPATASALASLPFDSEDELVGDVADIAVCNISAPVEAEAISIAKHQEVVLIGPVGAEPDERPALRVGAIFNSGSLTLADLTLSHNQVEVVLGRAQEDTFDRGGAVFTCVGCTLANNAAPRPGSTRRRNDWVEQPGSYCAQEYRSGESYGTRSAAQDACRESAQCTSVEKRTCTSTSYRSRRRRSGSDTTTTTTWTTCDYNIFNSATIAPRTRSCDSSTYSTFAKPFGLLQVSADGGAIHVNDAAQTCPGCKRYRAEFVAINTTFERNTAARFGGAVFVNARGVFDAQRSMFTNNEAQSGGAVYVRGRAEFSECVFASNVARGGSNDNNHRGGGAVYIASVEWPWEYVGPTWPRLEPYDDDDDDDSDDVGNGAYCDSYMCSDDFCGQVSDSCAKVPLRGLGAARFDGCTFRYNEALVGGAVAAHSDSAYDGLAGALAAFYECEFLDNTATLGGNGIFSSSKVWDKLTSVTISDSAFLNSNSEVEVPREATVNFPGRETCRVRIAGGGACGRLEMSFGPRGFGAVCDDGFGRNEAAAVCRTLGFQGGSYEYSSFDASHGGLGFAADDIDCPSGASSLSSCTMRSPYSHNCGAYETVGIDCGGIGCSTRSGLDIGYGFEVAISGDVDIRDSSFSSFNAVNIRAAPGFCDDVMGENDLDVLDLDHDDSCSYADDDECDYSNGLCSYGTDRSDCEDEYDDEDDDEDEEACDDRYDDEGPDYAASRDCEPCTYPAADQLTVTRRFPLAWGWIVLGTLNCLAGLAVLAVGEAERDDHLVVVAVSVVGALVAVGLLTASWVAVASVGVAVVACYCVAHAVVDEDSLGSSSEREEQQAAVALLAAFSTGVFLTLVQVWGWFLFALWISQAVVAAGMALSDEARETGGALAASFAAGSLFAVPYIISSGIFSLDLGEYIWWGPRNGDDRLHGQGFPWYWAASAVVGFIVTVAAALLRETDHAAMYGLAGLMYALVVTFVLLQWYGWFLLIGFGLPAAISYL